MRVRFSLYLKILMWLCVNLIALGLVLSVVFNLQFRLAPDSRLLGDSGHRIEAVAQLISAEVNHQDRTARDAILQRYKDAYRVDFFLVTNTGLLLAGPSGPIPEEVLAQVMRPGLDSRPVPEPRPVSRPGPDRPPPPHPVFSVKTANPTCYWIGVRIPVIDREQPLPVRATLLAASDSMSGHGLFFDPKPWAVIILAAFVVSVLIWLPFVRSLTRTIAQMTAATEQIAEERFAVRIAQTRSDELGRLSAAINYLAVRLSGFVTGQKRFLGDIAHELNSPLGRMQMALGILEQRVDPACRDYVIDVQEEVQAMSRLVSELLIFARAGIQTSDIRLEPVPVRPLVEQTVAQEAARERSSFHLEIEETMTVVAQPELLGRALANLIRNAVRYAGDAGPIRISAVQEGGKIQLVVADQGPGVPETELAKLFDPFYRLERDRARQTGGTGLGLAIVKSCVEACQGCLAAKNLKPAGFEVTITLPAAS